MVDALAAETASPFRSQSARASANAAAASDIFKALALGATAVCIGRPYVWGLAAFGQPGVEAVLDIFRRELVTVMRQAGTRRIRDISRSYVVDRRVG